MVNSGRTLNLISVGITVYLLAGADFQSIGVSGLAWEILYPQVIKLAAVVLWLWAILKHWVAGCQGAYYRAWVANSKDKTHPGVTRTASLASSADDPAEQHRSAEEYFGVPLKNHRDKSRFELAYVNKSGVRPGVYVCQVAKEQSVEPTRQREIADNMVILHNLPSSDRYGLLKLHLQFPDVFVRILLNDVDVLAHRTMPWILAAITASLLVANMFTDVSKLSGLVFHAPV